jgi:putative oxidoreductase
VHEQRRAEVVGKDEPVANRDPAAAFDGRRLARRLGIAWMATRLPELAARAEPRVFAALRVVTGALLSFHGMQKLFGWPPGGHTVAVASQLGAGGVIELVCGTLVAVGLFARPAAFLASGTMAVAYFQFHWRLAFAGAAWLPIVNKGEPAVVYCFLFLYIAAHGAGIASLDAARGRTSRS